MTGLFQKGPKDHLKIKITQRKKELKKLVKQKQYEKALKTGSEILENSPHDLDVLFVV